MQKSELKAMAKTLSTDCGKGFLIGNDVYFAPVHVNGKYFHFTPSQTQFLYQLTLHKGDLTAACQMVGWTQEKAVDFFATRKWKEYRERLLATAAVRNGDLREFWWEFMTDGAKGFKERWEGTCSICNQDYKLPPQVAEQYRNDNMDIQFNCKFCQNVVALTYIEEPFKPSREQVQCAVEIGQRVEPKTERVSHSFSDETFIFATGERE
jgi:hypothetical protein